MPLISELQRAHLDEDGVLRMMMHSRTWIAAFAMLATPLSGCGAPAGADGDDIVIESEAVNLAANFKLGLRDVRYGCDTCTPYIGPPVQTASLSEAAVSQFGWT